MAKPIFNPLTGQFDFVQDVSGYLKKSGDIMTGALTLADLTNALNSADYSIQMKSGIADGATAQGFLLDTVNDMTTSGAQIFTVCNAGTNLFHLEKAGARLYNKMAVGSTAQIGGGGNNKAIMHLSDTVTVTSVGSETPALKFEVNVIGTAFVPIPIGLKSTITISGTGGLAQPKGMYSELVQNSVVSWSATTFQPSYYSKSSSTVLGTGIPSNTTGFYVSKPSYLGAKPTSSYGFVSENIGVSGITNAYGMYLKKQSGATNNYGIWLGGDGQGAEITFGAGKDAHIQYDGTDLNIDTALVGTGTLNLVSQTATAVTTETLTEYITIKVGGVLKKLAIIA